MLCSAVQATSISPITVRPAIEAQIDFKPPEHSRNSRARSSWRMPKPAISQATYSS
jgi:hypothetical protein